MDDLIRFVQENRPKPKIMTETDLYNINNAINGNATVYRQRKLDGFRMTLIVTDNNIICMGATKSIDLSWMLGEWILPKNTILDCELYSPEHHASSIPTLVISKSPHLRLGLFAVPVLGGKDLTLMDPLDGICRLVQAPWVPRRIDIVDLDPVIHELNIEEQLDDARGLGIEGWVYKLDNWTTWFKLKPQKTCDLFVGGFQEGKGEFRGMLGSLSCYIQRLDKVELVANVSSGLTKQQRKEIWDHRGMYYEKVLEVEYQSIQSKGGLQFPRFVRWREDKECYECDGRDIC